MLLRPIWRTAILAATLIAVVGGCTSTSSSVAPSTSASPPSASPSSIPSAVASAIASAAASALSSGLPGQSPLPMSVKSLTKSAKPGDHAGITIATEDGAECKITVTYANGPSTASGLEPAIAASNGYVSWGWTVDAGTPAGDWPIDIVCTRGGRTGELHEKLTVK